MKKEYTLQEVIPLIQSKLDKKEMITQIKTQLSDMHIPSNMIDDALIEIAKNNQKKNVENLRKKGEFIPDMTEAELKKFRLEKMKVEKASAATSPGAKKEEPKKKK